MYRFLLTPRWWTINVFVALAIPFCLFMGSWQLGRFEDRVDGHRSHQQQAEAAVSAEAVPLETLLPPTTDTVGEVGSVEGRYDPEQELLVPGRTLDGERGFYVLTPLLRDDGEPALPVVRGWLPGEPDPAVVPAPADGEVTVVGLLQAPESPRAVSAPTGLPTGQVGVIGAASLINLLPYDVENAWMTVREVEEPLTAVPPVAPSGTGLDIKAFQNLGYTAEWFVFAAFTVFMWFRLFRREVETVRDAELGIHPDGPAPGAAPAADTEAEAAPEDGDRREPELSGSAAGTTTAPPSA
ncbi:MULTISPECIES: SURF1 family protein [unclassified Streptomyces]|uniref:SURF1 family protein n=1 Tax=unclassified Streptomyces TaxID=2593676 RepID=UPI000CD5B72B|nr:MULTISPECIES: SURF1 family protein [unclassified Streptomyces]